MSVNGQQKLGLALSGAAARSAFYIGFLEVLQEQNIKVDYIAAQSGATITAAAFACGTLDVLKEMLFSLERRKLLQLLRPAAGGNGGVLSLEKMEELVREKITLGKNLEEVRPHLVFVATDLETAEAVRLEMGDLARACRYSCTVPGLFQAEKWGSRVLVDGGLVSYIPGQFARESGADVVVGVNVRATQHIFPKKWMKVKTWYNWAKNRKFLRHLGMLWYANGKQDEQEKLLDILEPWVAAREKAVPGTFSVLGRAVDIATTAAKQTRLQAPNFGCDLLISEGAGEFGASIKIRDMKVLYLDGKKTAQRALPEIIAMTKICRSKI